MTKPSCYIHEEKPAVQSCRDCYRPVCEVCVQVDEVTLDMRCPTCMVRAQKKRRYTRASFAAAVVLFVSGAVGLYAKYDRPYQYLKYASTIRSLQKELQQEPCDRQKTLDLVQNLFWAGDYRVSLKVAHQFFDTCGEFSRLRWLTFESHKMLSEFDAAIAEVTKLIEENQQNKNFWAWRGLLYEDMGKLEQAAGDFRQVISIEPPIIGIPFNLANIYERLGQYCEAILPVEQYLFYYPTQRQEPRVQSRLSKLYQRPECTEMYGDGRAVVRFAPGAPVISATARFNDKILGEVIIDTGATFVTLSKSFAERLNLIPQREATIYIETAGGVRSAQLSTLDLIELQGARARKIPVAILDDEGMHVDVLLGLSFLSRFSIQMDSVAGRFELTSKH